MEQNAFSNKVTANNMGKLYTNKQSRTEFAHCCTSANRDRKGERQLSESATNKVKVTCPEKYTTSMQVWV